MKVLFSIFCSFFCSSITFAQNEIKSSGYETVYEKINTLYDTGVRFNLDIVVSKVASGRCFAYEAANTPLAAAFTASKTIHEVGPIHDPVASYTAIATIDHSVPPAYFDSEEVTINNPKVRVDRLPVLPFDIKTFLLKYPSQESFFFRYSNSSIVGRGFDGDGKQTYACYFFRIH